MWNIAPLVLSTILKDFFTSYIVKSKILRNHWLRYYFVKLVDRGECKIIGTRRIVEFLHKCTNVLAKLFLFSLLASSGFFHYSGLERNVNLIFNLSLYTHIPNIKSISQSIVKTSGDNCFISELWIWVTLYVPAT